MFHIEKNGPWRVIGQVLLAAAICQVQVTVSVAPQAPSLVPLTALAFGDLVAESEARLCRRLTRSGADRLRVLTSVSRSLQEAANADASHIPIIDEPMLASGRLELRRYVREQTVSETTRRYGNVLPRTRTGAA